MVWTWKESGSYRTEVAGINRPRTPGWALTRAAREGRFPMEGRRAPGPMPVALS